MIHTLADCGLTLIPPAAAVAAGRPENPNRSALVAHAGWVV